MLGALQPFISGACSKTVNMPVSAGVQDIYDSLIMSHELGVKCIAIFRAGSKANAVYVVDTPETRMFKANHVWEQLVNAGSDAIDEIIAGGISRASASCPAAVWARPSNSSP